MAFIINKQRSFVLAFDKTVLKINHPHRIFVDSLIKVFKDTVFNLTIKFYHILPGWILKGRYI